MCTIPRKYCLTNTSYLTELLVISILFDLGQNYACYGGLLYVRTLCGAYHGLACNLNLQRNIVVRQIAQKCCPYHFALMHE